MIGRICALLAGLVAAVIQAAFVASLPPPLCGINLVVIAITLFVSAFRFENALTAAAAAGLTLDLLTGTPTGVQGAIVLASAGAAIIIFTRILTNVSISSFAVLNIAAGTVVSIITLLAFAAMDALSGLGLRGAGAAEWPLFLAGLVIHGAAAAAAMVVFDQMRRRLSRRFLLIRYDRRRT